VTFVDDDRNDIHSSQGIEGYCPPPGDTGWQPGMTAGHFCLQLTIEDGGPNDADGEINSAISDPGAVGVLIPVQVTPNVQTTPAAATSITTSSIHSSGGGSLGWAMIVMLLLLGSFKAYAVDWASMTKKSFVELEVFSAKGAHDKNDFANDMAGAGVNVDVTSYDALRTAYQVSLGYTYNPYATFLLSYTDLGDVSVDFDTTTTDEELIEQALNKAYPLTGDGVSIAYRYRYSFMRRWSVFADAGVFFWNNDVDLGGASSSPDIDGGTDPMFALGIDYSLLRRTSLGLKYRYHRLDEQSLNGLGLLLRVNF
jgi:large repetitive protein